MIHLFVLFLLLRQSVQIGATFAPNSTNGIFRTLFPKCQETGIGCLQQYLTNILDHQGDLKVLPFLKFNRNAINYVDDDFAKLKASSPRSLTFKDTLISKSIKFLLTHDIEFGSTGGELRLGARSFDNNGLWFKVDFVPRSDENGVEIKEADDEDASVGRIFIKKIKKFVGEKLMFALLAILLVIKLLAVKAMFVLPAMLGAVTAKKLLIKVLLFLFPALSHIFKLCPYVPHSTKFHHHKHKINHIHHVSPFKPYPHGPSKYPSYPGGGAVEVIRPHDAGPPDGGHYYGSISGGGSSSGSSGFDYDDGHHSYHHFLDTDPLHKQSYNPHEEPFEYYAGGPGLSEDFASHRQDTVVESSSESNHNEIPTAWGQGHHYSKKQSDAFVPGPLSPSEIEIILEKAEKESQLKLRLQEERRRIYEENLRLQAQVKEAARFQEKLKQTQQRFQSVPVNIPSITLSPPLLMTTTQSMIQKSTPFSLNTPKPLNNNLNNINQSKKQPENTKEQQYKLLQRLQQKQQLENQYQEQHNQLLEQLKMKRLEDDKIRQTQLENRKIALDQRIKQQKQQQKVNSKFEELTKAAAITYDPFYTPILDKIESILRTFNLNEEACKERLICSMYKNPEKYSPHSNLLSVELSRDSKELKKPTTTNAAVIRFYRYLQAARDGQDKKECVNFYPNCSINTEE